MDNAREVPPFWSVSAYPSENRGIAYRAEKVLHAVLRAYPQGTQNLGNDGGAMPLYE